jgi:RNA polymerase sigma-70 factor, ECF subfamily
MLGSTDDFREFYEASYGRTLAMVAALVGGRAEAEDVTQEAFARALSRWTLLRSYERPDAWVRKVALRLAIDTGRRQRRRLATVIRLAGLRQPADSEPADDLQFSPLGAALAELPLRERQVLVLHYLADLPVDMIAQELSLPPGTVKTRLGAGRRHLEERLSQQPEAVGQ